LHWSCQQKIARTSHPHPSSTSFVQILQNSISYMIYHHEAICPSNFLQLQGVDHFSLVGIKHHSYLNIGRIVNPTSQTYNLELMCYWAQGSFVCFIFSCTQGRHALHFALFLYVIRERQKGWRKPFYILLILPVRRIFSIFYYSSRKNILTLVQLPYSKVSFVIK
jgi:hypothetical protein